MDISEKHHPFAGMTLCAGTHSYYFVWIVNAIVVTEKKFITTKSRVAPCSSREYDCNSICNEALNVLQYVKSLSLGPYG